MVLTKTDKLDRSRFVAFTYFYYRHLHDQELWKLISNQSNILFGVKGAIKMGLYQIYVSNDRPYAIYRVSHTNVTNFYMLLCSIRKFTERPISFISLQVSGTIKSLAMLEHTFDGNIHEHSEININD